MTSSLYVLLAAVAVCSLASAQTSRAPPPPPPPPEDYKQIFMSCKDDIKALCPNATTPASFADCFSTNVACISANCTEAVAVSYSQRNPSPAGAPPTIQIQSGCQDFFLQSCGQFPLIADQLNCWRQVDPSSIPLSCLKAVQQTVVPLNFTACDNDIQRSCSGSNDPADKIGCLTTAPLLNGNCTNLVKQLNNTIAQFCGADIALHGACHGLNVKATVSCLISNNRTTPVSSGCHNLVAQFTPPPPPVPSQPVPGQFQDPLAPCNNGAPSPDADCLKAIVSKGFCTDLDFSLNCVHANTSAVALLNCYAQAHANVTALCASRVEKILNWFPNLFGPTHAPPGQVVAGMCSPSDIAPPPPPPPQPNGHGGSTTTPAPGPTTAPAFPCAFPSTFTWKDVLCFVTHAAALKGGKCRNYFANFGGVLTAQCLPDLIATRCNTAVGLSNQLTCLLHHNATLGHACAAVFMNVPNNRRMLASSSNVKVAVSTPLHRRSLLPADAALDACTAESADNCPGLVGVQDLMCLARNQTIAVNPYSAGCTSALQTAITNFQIPADIQTQCLLELNFVANISSPICTTASGIYVLICAQDNQASLTFQSTPTQTSCTDLLTQYYARQNNGANVQLACHGDVSHLCPAAKGPALVACINANFTLLSTPCQQAVSALPSFSNGKLPPPPAGCSPLDATTANGASALVVSSGFSQVVQAAFSISYAAVDVGTTTGSSPTSTTPTTVSHASGASNGAGSIVPEVFFTIFVGILGLLLL